MMPLLVPLLVAGGAALVLAFDLLFPAPRRAAWLAIATMVGTLVASHFCDQTGSLGAYAYDGAVAFFQRLVLGIGIVTVLGHVGARAEYYFLLLLSIAGMCLLPGTQDLLLLVLAFELMGIPLYVLATIDRSAEAGLKLYLVGAASTAVTLFGLSLIVGLAGSTRFSAIAVAATASSPLFVAGLMLVIAGMAFKLGVAPFHMWVPDTYQGASTPFVAFLSTAPKAAAVAALARVLLGATPGLAATYTPALVALAAATMALGTFLAVPQMHLKRLLGYSGIAHMGYLLLGFASGASGLGLVFFYLTAYAVTNVGIFLVAHAVAQADGVTEELPTYAGLARRQPWLALALLLFLLSLAGIPFVAGFWAKLYVFIAAWRAGFGAIVVAGALLSVLGLFVYLRVAREAYLVAPARPGPVRVAPPLRVAIIACLVGVIVMGLIPGPFVDAAMAAARAWGGP